MKNNKYVKAIVFMFAVIVLVNAGAYIFSGALTSQKTEASQSSVSLVTYKNSKYGFQVHYPSSWQATESADGVIINPPSAGGNVYFGVSADNRSLADIKTLLSKTNILTTDVTVGGELGFEYADTPGHEAMFVAHNNQTFILRVYDSVTDSMQASQILASFTFTH